MQPVPVQQYGSTAHAAGRCLRSMCTAKLRRRYGVSFAMPEDDANRLHVMESGRASIGSPASPVCFLM
jgi:hypothetical protein